MAKRLTIYACESQPIVLEGLSRVLTGCEDMELLGAAPTLPETLEALRVHHPDIVLVDQAAGLKVVFQFIADVKSIWAGCHPVLWIHEMAEIDCFRALQIGARGIVKKTFPVSSLVECLRSVGAGRVWIENAMSSEVAGLLHRRSSPRLTPREREIVKHVCAGRRNKEIAELLSITPGTVKVHLMHIFEKTGVKDRFELAVHGRRLLGGDELAEVGAKGAVREIASGSAS